MCGQDERSAKGPGLLTRQHAGWTVLYLALSGLSGVLELGVLILAARGWTVVEIPFFALAYQVGSLLSQPVRLPRSMYALAGLVGGVCALLGSTSAMLLFVGILGTSTSLQHVRDVVGKRCHVSTFWKRVARVSGFIIAPWLSGWMLGIGGLCLAVSAVAVGWVATPVCSKRQVWPSLDLLAIAMLVHQSHYFLYSCFLPLVFLQIQGISISLVGLAFALGWVSYCFAPRLLQGWHPGKVFVFGHLLVVLSLIVLSLYATSSSVVLAAWFASGFGGGTVFCLRNIERAQGRSNEGHLDSWENMGHVAGVLAVIVVISVWADPHIVFVVAAGVALCTAAIGVVIARRVSSSAS